MAGPKTDKSGRIQRRNGNGNGQGGGLAAMLQSDRVKAQIAVALPKHVHADRMARVALTAVRKTPKLAHCDQTSFLASLMTCAQLGLEPSTPLGHAYLIPFDNRKAGRTEAQLIIGYQGFIELARRSGEVRSIYAHAVRSGDDFDYELGLEPTLRHRPSEAADRESQPITHVYAVAKLKDADPIFVVLTHAQIEARRNRSRAAKSGPWVTDYEAMCLKTGIRALWRWLPKSVEMARATEIDEAADRGVSIGSVLEDEQINRLASQGMYIDTTADEGEPPAEPEAEQEPAPDDAPKPGVIRWGPGKGHPLRLADADVLTAYLDEVEAEFAQGDDSLEAHRDEIHAEIDRRTKTEAAQ